MSSRPSEFQREAQKHTEVTRIDENLAQQVAQNVEDYDSLVRDAAKATEYQQNMGLREGLRTYPRAVMWSVILSSAIVMEGYDTMLMGNFFAQPAFTRKYGECNAEGKCEIPAPWQNGLGNGSQVGSIIGLQLTGILSERYGYRFTICTALTLITAFIFIPFFAKNLTTLLIGQILMGFPWGVFQTLTTAYAAEVCPVALRAYLTTYVNLCWVIGQLIATGILRGVITRNDQWAYRIPFAIQWVWPIPILIACIFAPESPWWLVRKGRHEDAERSLRRLASVSAGFTHEDAQRTIAMMIHTNELEKQVSSGGRYFDCFRGTDGRRTEIAIVVWVIQTSCGSPLMGSSSYFYLNAGLAPVQAANFSVYQFALGFVGTVSSWPLMRFAGRRTLYLYGQAILCGILLIVGILGFYQHKNSGVPWVIGSCLLVFTFVYDITVGPVCYCLVAEISSTRLRAKTIVLARNFYNIAGIVAGTIQPRMLNTTAWNLGAKCGLVWLGTAIVGLVWTYFRLPEPKGRTYGELDILFENGVPARKFRTTRVEQYGNAGTKSDKIAEVEGEKA